MAATALSCNESSWDNKERSVFIALKLSILLKHRCASTGDDLSSDEDEIDHEYVTGGENKTKKGKGNRCIHVRPIHDNDRYDHPARAAHDKAMRYTFQTQHLTTYADKKLRAADPPLFHSMCSISELTRVAAKTGNKRLLVKKRKRPVAVFLVDEYTEKDPTEYLRHLGEAVKSLQEGNNKYAKIVSNVEDYYNILYKGREGVRMTGTSSSDIYKVKAAEQAAEQAVEQVAEARLAK